MKKVLTYVLAALWMLPFLVMFLIALSSKNTTSFTKLFDLSTSTLNNFLRAWTEGAFSRYFLNTVIVTLVSVMIILGLTALAGYVMGRFEFGGKKVLYHMMILSMGIPTIFFTIPVYQLLRILHADSSIIGLILAEIGGGHIIFLLLFANFFASVPSELEESAVIDGATEFDIFFKVMFPLSKPIIGTVVITQSIWTWNSFLYPLILSVNDPSIRTLSVGMYAFQGENIVDWGSMAAGACITILPMVILFIVFQRYFINGISGAVKG